MRCTLKEEDRAVPDRKGIADLNKIFVSLGYHLAVLKAGKAKKPKKERQIEDLKEEDENG